MLLEEMKEIYLNDVEINLAEGSFEFYKNHLSYCCNWFKNNGLLWSDDVTLKVLTEFVLEQHKRGLSNSTINKRILALKNMFKFNEIDNAVLNMKKYKEVRNTYLPIVKSDFERLVDYLNSDVLKFHNKLIFYILIDTGIRMKELINIKVKNINFSNNTILLEFTKCKKKRLVPFTEATAFLLKEYLKKYNGEYLIPIKYSSIESLFDRVEKKLNISKLHPHALRHTLSTKLHKNGVSLVVIQRIMGHTNLTTTQRYIHIDIEDVLQSYNAVM